MSENPAVGTPTTARSHRPFARTAEGVPAPAGSNAGTGLTSAGAGAANRLASHGRSEITAAHPGRGST